MSGKGLRHEVRAVLIAGPTASGKSALALEIAAECGGGIVNADSMQVYADLHIITARPIAAEMQRVPHRLYGHVDAGVTYSTGAWLRDAQQIFAQAWEAGRVPVVVGGTGLYFKLLTSGLAAVPSIPDDLRAGLRARLAAEGAGALHADLVRRDPPSAERLHPGDGSRIVRALEVLEATGRPLWAWHERNAPPVLDPAGVVKLFAAPDRETLRARINARFDAMLAAGALAEVTTLAARGLDPLLPAMKAHGVPWLIRHLGGEIGLEEAADGAKADTRRYAKRQFTFARNQLPDWPWLDPEAARAFVMQALASGP